MAGCKGKCLWLEELVASLDASLDKELFRQSLELVLHQRQNSSREKHAHAEEWMQWAGQREHLKVVSVNVPADILPSGTQGRLHDIKVFTKHGPDDAIYDQNEDIREKVARGNCFLELLDGPDRGTSCLIYAQKKFTGGLGDEDDIDRGDNFTWKKYFLKPMSEAQTVVCTRKANGEAAHLSARRLAEGHILVCAGSKNVHMLVKDGVPADIEKYTDSRYNIAREVCQCIMELLQELAPDKRKQLLEFLCDTELTGVFEIISPAHQHVEDFSHMSKAELNFITWTSTDLSGSRGTHLCSMPPNVALELARQMGLPTVDYKIIPVSQVEDRLNKIRKGYGYEGEVLYFLDSSSCVIGLLKKKTIWYILCRAVREKVRAAATLSIKKKASFDMNKSLDKVEKRVGEIQTWLGLNEETTQQWKQLGVKFIKWSIQGLEDGSLQLQGLTDLFPVTWKRYLKEIGETDKVIGPYCEPGGSDD